MALTIQTTIRNMRDVDASDFEADSVYHELVRLQQTKQPVTVDGICTDGYYNITTPAGTEVEGLSWYHLDEFCEDGPASLLM